MTDNQQYQNIFQQTVARSLQFVYNQTHEQAFSDDMRDDGLAALDIALNPQIATEVWLQTQTLLVTLSPKMEQAGYWSSWQPYLLRGLEISQLLSDQQSEAELSLQIGILQQRQGQLESAANWYHACTLCAKAISHITIWTEALNRQGLIACTQHKIDEASAYIAQALKLMPLNDSQREFSYYVLGNIALKEYEYEQATDYFQKSLDICKQNGDRHQMACRLKDLGVAFRRQNMPQAALSAYEKALEMLQEVNDPVEFAITKMNQGIVYAYSNEPQTALLCYAEAKPIFEKTFNSLNLAKLYHSQAYCYRELQRWSTAEEMYHASLTQWRQIESWVDYANVLDGLGLVYYTQGMWDKAIKTFRDALQILSDVTESRSSKRLSQEITEHLQNAYTELTSAQTRYG